MTDKTKDKKDRIDTIKKVTIGGVAGIMLATGGIATAQTLMNQSGEDDLPTDGEGENQDTTANNDGELHVAHNVDNSMSFAEAFKTARAEIGSGGLFHWHGNSYSTFTAEEWDNMSQADKNAYAQLVESEVKYDINQHPHHEHHDHAHQHHHEHHHDQVVPDVAEESVTPETQQGGVDLRGVEFSNIHQEMIDDGSIITVGDAFVDGVEIAAADINNDGVFDVAGVDFNGNGQFDENEYFDISNQGIRAEGSQQLEVSQQNGGVDMAQEPQVNDTMATVVETAVDMVGIAQAMGVEIPEEVTDIVGAVGGMAGLGIQQVQSFDETADNGYDNTLSDAQVNQPNIAESISNVTDAINDLVDML